MNKLMKVGFAALAISAVTPVFADEAEAVESEYDAIGWTPIAVGIASPVQLPWGSHTWDVFGINLGVLWTDAPKVGGIDVTGIASATRGYLKGIKISGLCNWNTADVYGIRATAGSNISFGDTYGIDLSTFSYRQGGFWGADVNFIGTYSKMVKGLEISGVVNLASEMSYGWTVAVGGNMAAKAYGCQTGLVFNFTDELHGCQLGLINFARECPWGFQIGLINIIMDNKLKVLPIVNAYF